MSLAGCKELRIQKTSVWWFTKHGVVSKSPSSFQSRLDPLENSNTNSCSFTWYLVNEIMQIHKYSLQSFNEYKQTHQREWCIATFFNYYFLYLYFKRCPPSQTLIHEPSTSSALLWGKWSVGYMGLEASYFGPYKPWCQSRLRKNTMASQPAANSSCMKGQN